MSRLGIAVLSGATLLAVASRLSWLGRPFYNDAGLYVAVGKVVAGGGRFYREVWDTKLPSVALLMWPQYLAFGDRWWAYVASQLLLGLGAAAIVARIVDVRIVRRAALFTLAFALVAFDSLTFTGSGLQLETFQLFFASLAAMLFLRRYLFVERDPIYAVADKVRSLTTPDERVFADPLGGLLMLADRPPGARLGMMIGLLNHDDAPRTLMDGLLADLEERRPAVIVLPGPSALEERLRGWETQPILRDNPERRRNFRAAWRRFLAYVETHYAAPVAVEGSEIRRRKP